MREEIAGLISTIIPVHNRPVQLREAVASVLAQDYRPIEIIIVDDGSTDDTPAVAKALAAAHPDIVRVAVKANGGPGLAREHGRQIARGEFLQYLDSDDLLLPGKFSRQAAALRADPACDVAFGVTRLRRADGRLETESYKETGVRVDTMFPKFLTGRWWETATPLYRAAVCAAAGPWTDLRLEEDWEYDCRIASLGGRLAWCPDPVSETRDHPGARLSRGEALDPVRLQHRARAHELILGHAFRFGITPEVPEMKHFARALFLLSRQCGAAGLAAESMRLFELARAASGPQGAGLDFSGYRLVSRLIGWTRAGKLSCMLDHLRGGR